MSFSARFPRQVGGKTEWEEITLTSLEEKEVEKAARLENYRLLRECIEDAKNIALKHDIKDEKSIVALATSLFDKRG